MLRRGWGWPERAHGNHAATEGAALAVLRALTDDTPSWWWVSLLPALAWLVGALWVVRPTRRELALHVAPLTAALAIPAVAIGIA